MGDDERGVPTPARLAARVAPPTVGLTAAGSGAGAPAGSAPSGGAADEAVPASEVPASDVPATDVPVGATPAGVVPPGHVTGDAAVDEALRVLDGLAERPLGEHVAAFDAVHSALQDRLAESQG
ncbi:hypothetical protein [Cellulomonas uda]|uniref:Uncharacterized protein n=1 Tax=Cellulomonas uda TaxID=1714 RepID=A0A4Y3K9C8_CELUD|nr:hypothetical protein [Cellulomonas uda]NII66069.1 hypothetical protein [Cellulomonas uda]GEA81101.1 hypothetical protein CUD01_15450 [Cellulomonas uda]